MKKTIFNIAILILLFISLSFSSIKLPVFAEEISKNPISANSAEAGDEVNVYFFWGEGCPHCENQKPFLKKMEAKYPNIQIHDYEIWKSAENRKLMQEFGKKLGATVNGVPFTVIGEKYVVGWMDEANTGKQIEDAIKCAVNQMCRDVGEEIITSHQNIKKEPGVETSTTPETLTLPLIGEIQTKNFSLPILTIIIAALDGFNPCAMWTLLFLISLLLGMKDKKRMWTLGVAFIVTSGAVYFLFLSAWLNLLLFIGFILWVRILIGLVALGGGSYYLKEYFLNPNAGCTVTKSEKRKRVFEKLKQLTHESNFWIALGGVILLAIAVNMVELVCSAGLPAVYTQILTLSELSMWQYYGYLLLYIFIFMLDDLFVFFVAMTTLRMTGVNDKYSHISHLIGGIVMIIIGILLLFKPELLMFG